MTRVHLWIRPIDAHGQQTYGTFDVLVTRINTWLQLWIKEKLLWFYMVSHVKDFLNPN